MKKQQLLIILILNLGAHFAFSEDISTITDPLVEADTIEENVFSENSALVSLLIIEGMNGVGTGFITTINGKVFAVTNLHVMAGFGDPLKPNVSIKTVQNEKLNIENVYGAKDHDIALIQFSESASFENRALKFEGNTQRVKSGDKVKIPGNSKGKGVILWTAGEVRGVGTTKIEHSAPTFRGNSGSPVIHIPTNSVIGVDTETTYDPIVDPFDKAARSSEDSAIKDDFRYFAYRLDTPNSWYKIDLREFQKQSQQLQEWKVERDRAIGFIQSFLGFESEYDWWDENRLQGIATSFLEDIQKMSSVKREFTRTDGVYDYYSIYQVILPKEKSRLRRKVIGMLHNYIGLVDKKNDLKKGNIYPFLHQDYEREIEWSEWLTRYLHNNRDFLSELH